MLANALFQNVHEVFALSNRFHIDEEVLVQRRSSPFKLNWVHGTEGRKMLLNLSGGKMVSNRVDSRRTFIVVASSM